MTYPGIFRLRNNFIVLFPLRFLTSRGILYINSACVYTKFKKNATVFLLSTILNPSQSALHMLLMTHTRKMFYNFNNSDCYGYPYSKSLKTFRRWSLVKISLLKLMMRPEPLYPKTRSVVNISSEYTSTSLVGLKRSLEFLTL